VQEGRHVESTARDDLADDVAGGGGAVAEFALLDAVEDADRPDRVLVDRVGVVHVVLHLRDDPPERRDEAGQHTRLAEPPQRRLGIVRRGQHLHEETVRLLVFPQRSID